MLNAALIFVIHLLGNAFVWPMLMLAHLMLNAALESAAFLGAV
jgi:hypothetical protein